MPFTVAESSLESLEWAKVVAALSERCRTPLGPPAIDRGGLIGVFETSETGVRTRMAETTEARHLIDSDSLPPLHGASDLREALGRAERGGVLEGGELVDVRRTLEAMHATRSFFERRQDEASQLASCALEIEEVRALENRLTRCLDEGGDVLDSASSKLAKARNDARRLSGELKSRIERSLQNAEIKPHLSDQFYTVRNGRFVLPVKADAKGQVRGIVHDASRSGTTLFVEPDATVELNNRHREAELTVDRETHRVMRELSDDVGNDSASIQAGLRILTRIDLAIARGILSRDMDAVEPEIGREGVFELPGLRHPLISPEECVPNDLRVGENFSVLLLSGPNAGGKTVALKAIALSTLMVRAGMHVAADPGARVDLVERVLADIGDHQDIQESLSTFSAAMTNLAEILRAAMPNTIACLDEIGVGTDPSEGAAIAQATLEALAASGARVVTTTHYNLLKEMAQVDDRFENASVEFDPETMAPTYRVRMGTQGASSATTVARRMGVPEGVLDRAATLLDREDRRLDQMLSELAASRAQLETEQRTATALRTESERMRDEYRAKLGRLQERRDQLFGDMRRDLDESFRSAHSEVARIIAELQRDPSSRRAARAREQLETVREHTEEDQAERGLEPKVETASTERKPIDWSQARLGDVVEVRNGGTGTLYSLPDRKKRVRVQLGGARVTLDQDALFMAGANGSAPAPATVVSEKPLPPLRIGGTQEVDLRGLRVEEALDSLDTALDLAAAEGRDELHIIHGIGTGALKRAVREHLPGSPYVVECTDAAREEGGAGAVRAILRKD